MLYEVITTNNLKLNHDSQVVVRGVAFDDGHGIREVLISLDEGKTWENALLDDGSQGRYGFRAFRFGFKPSQYGKLTIMSKAINNIGEDRITSYNVCYTKLLRNRG